MHPVSFDLDYSVERNRLTAFFRLILAIPWFIVGALYGLAALVVVVIAWFALLFTKHYPEGMYSFVAGYVRFSGRVGGWVLLGADPFPPFDGKPDPDYPVHVDVAPRQEEYSRAKTFFKFVLIFPQQILLYGIGFLLQGAAFISWFRILFTGKQSVTMHDALRVAFAYSVRAHAFMLFLTEVHPRMLDLPQQQLPSDAPAMPRLGPGAGPPAAPEPAA